MLKLIFKNLNKNCNIFYTLNRSKSKISSNIWLDRQKKDPYVKRAIRESYRARSAFKLIEIDQKYKFLKPGHTIIDCGSSPGSWAQVCVQKTNSNGLDSNKPIGKVIGIDLEYIDPIDGAILFPYSSITDHSTFNKISKCLNEIKTKTLVAEVDGVISDMAPNSTGQSTFDHDAIIVLQKKAFDLAKLFLVDNGYFLCKIWFGDSTNEFTNMLSNYFQFVKLIKPDSSRGDSAEIFIFCSNFKKK